MLRHHFNKTVPPGLANGGMRVYTEPMRTPSALLLALLGAFASPVAAQQATPGTKAPVCSGDWGPGAEGMTLEDKARRLFSRLLNGAKGEIVVGGKKVKYDKNPELVVDLQHNVIAGSPAAAFSAGLGMNAPGKNAIDGKDHSARDLVYTTNALYEMCDQPEATIFVAHEIGHLALGHAAILEAKKGEIIDRLFGEWSATHTVPSDPKVAVRQFFADYGSKIVEELQPVQAPLEKEADEYGRELSLKIGIPVNTAENAFLRAQDWLWGMKLDMSDKGHGGTVHDRAVKSAEWAAQIRVQMQHAADAARRAKCAEQGMSCP